MRVVVRRVGTLPSSFSHPHKLPVSRPFSLSLFLSRRALSILVLSRTFLPHVLLASRQCLLARRGVAILGRKDSSESALAPPPPSSSALFLPSRRPSLTQDLSSCSLSPFGGSVPYVLERTPNRLLEGSPAGSRPPSRSRSLLSPYTRTYTRGAIASFAQFPGFSRTSTSAIAARVSDKSSRHGPPRLHGYFRRISVTFDRGIASIPVSE